MALYDVFISYSSKDQKVVEGICGYLEGRGVRCFVAFRDIPKGVVWASAIVDGLDESQMMVVAYSDSFNLSPQVDREIELAAEDNKPILTFRLSDSKFKGAKKYYLKNLNWIDAFPNPDNYFRDLYENVCKLLGKTPIPPIQIPQEPRHNNVVQNDSQNNSDIQDNICQNTFPEVSSIGMEEAEETNNDVINQGGEANSGIGNNDSSISNVFPESRPESIIESPVSFREENIVETTVGSIDQEEEDQEEEDQEEEDQEEEDPNSLPQELNLPTMGSTEDEDKTISHSETHSDPTPDPTPNIEPTTNSNASSAETDEANINAGCQINGYEWVDLGLPSGTKWATYNVGATRPEQYGGFFGWGEVEAMTSTKINKNILSYGKSYEELQNEGIIDKDGNLTPEFDAASRAWGEPWRIPTKEEIEEFENNTKGERITLNGVKGKLFTSKINGKGIFMPAAGMYDSWGGYISKGELSHIWSSTAKQSSKKKSYMFIIRKSYNCVTPDTRYLGYQVRPVCK